MKRYPIILVSLCLLLAACTALLPQTSAPQEAGDTSTAPGGVIVEEVVEQVVVSGPSPGTGEPTTVEIVGGDEAALREFITRWMSAPYSGQQGDHITIYLGSLPPDLPYTLPIPERARLIASVQQTRFDFLQLILDVPLSLEEVVSFYEQSLLETGWQAATNIGQGGGFVSAEMGLTYCLGEEKYLNLQAGPISESTTDVRMYVQGTEGYSPCRPASGYEDGISPLIPTLKNPPGSSMTGGGGGGSSDTDAYTEANLQTELPASEVAAYYHEQLQTVGWTLLESGGAEGHAWSYWSLTDEKGEEWFGTLILTKVPPSSDELFAYIRVAR